MLRARPIQLGAANCAMRLAASLSFLAVFNVAQRRAYRRARARPLHHPLCFTFFVKGCDAFAGFIRVARLQVILQRKIDIFLH